MFAQGRREDVIPEVRGQEASQVLYAVDVIQREHAAGAIEAHVRYRVGVGGEVVLAQAILILILISSPAPAPVPRPVRGELSGGLADEEPEPPLEVQMRRQEGQDDAPAERQHGAPKARGAGHQRPRVEREPADERPACGVPRRLVGVERLVERHHGHADEHEAAGADARPGLPAQTVQPLARGRGQLEFYEEGVERRGAGIVQHGRVSRRERPRRGQRRRSAQGVREGRGQWLPRAPQGDRDRPEPPRPRRRRGHGGIQVFLGRGQPCANGGRRDSCFDGPADLFRGHVQEAREVGQPVHARQAVDDLVRYYEEEAYRYPPSSAAAAAAIGLLLLLFFDGKHKYSRQPLARPHDASDVLRVRVEISHIRRPAVHAVDGGIQKP